MLVDSDELTIQFKSIEEVEKVIQDLTSKLKTQVVLPGPAMSLMDALSMLTEEPVSMQEVTNAERQ